MEPCPLEGVYDWGLLSEVHGCVRKGLTQKSRNEKGETMLVIWMVGTITYVHRYVRKG